MPVEESVAGGLISRYLTSALLLDPTETLAQLDYTDISNQGAGPYLQRQEGQLVPCTDLSQDLVTIV